MIRFNKDYSFKSSIFLNTLYTIISRNKERLYDANSWSFDPSLALVDNREKEKGTEMSVWSTIKCGNKAFFCRAIWLDRALSLCWVVVASPHNEPIFRSPLNAHSISWLPVGVHIFRWSDRGRFSRRVSASDRSSSVRIQSQWRKCLQSCAITRLCPRCAIQGPVPRKMWCF